MKYPESEAEKLELPSGGKKILVKSQDQCVRTLPCVHTCMCLLESSGPECLQHSWKGSLKIPLFFRCLAQLIVVERDQSLTQFLNIIRGWLCGHSIRQREIDLKEWSQVLKKGSATSFMVFLPFVMLRDTVLFKS